MFSITSSLRSHYFQFFVVPPLPDRHRKIPRAWRLANCADRLRRFVRFLTMIVGYHNPRVLSSEKCRRPKGLGAIMGSWVAPTCRSLACRRLVVRDTTSEIQWRRHSCLRAHSRSASLKERQECLSYALPPGVCVRTRPTCHPEEPTATKDPRSCLILLAATNCRDPSLRSG